MPKLHAETLRRCHYQLTLHVKLGRGGYGYIYRCVEHPSWCWEIHRENYREPETKLMFVGDVEVPWNDLEAIAGELNAQAEAALISETYE